MARVAHSINTEAQCIVSILRQIASLGFTSLNLVQIHPYRVSRFGIQHLQRRRLHIRVRHNYTFPSQMHCSWFLEPRLTRVFHEQRNSDRDAKQKWANQLGGGWSIGGIGGQLLTGVVKNSVQRVFR